MQGIWELEPGAHWIEDVPLPESTGFDVPARLDVFLDAVRWGVASTADRKTIQSPIRSGIDIEDHQLGPVVRAIQMPRAKLLIAVDIDNNNGSGSDGRCCGGGGHRLSDGYMNGSRRAT